MNIKVDVGSTARQSCTIMHDPLSTYVSWKKNSVDISFKDDRLFVNPSTKQLVINNVQYSDEGKR